MESEARVKYLKKQRTNSKRALTMYENFLKKFNPDSDFPVLERRYLEIDSIRENFEKIQSEIEFLDEDAIDSESNRTDFEEKYFNTYGMATRLLEGRPSKTQISVPAVAPAESNQTQDLNVASFNFSNLPKINLPTFSGSYDKWPGFRDLFQTFVDADSRIPYIQKLVYLKGCLTGEAASVIDSIDLSPDNYQVAWGLLNNRYDNKRIICHNHIKYLLNLSCVSKEFSVRSLADEIQRNIRALKALKEPVDSWSSILIVLVFEKLNNFLRDKWHEHIAESTFITFEQMLAFLERRAQLDDARLPQSHKTSNLSVPHPSARKNSHTLQNARIQSFPVSTSKYQYAFCQEDHCIYSCKKFEGLSPNELYEAAKRSVLCLNCFRKNHHADKCSSQSCKNCHQRHQILLHFERREIVNSPDAHIPTPWPSTSVNMHALPSSEALLATAMVDLVNSRGDSKPCRVFLDAGSQAHFITSEIATFLNLNRKSVNISVSGVEGIRTEVQQSVSVLFKSRFSRYQKTIECLVIPNITKQMPSINLNITNLERPKNVFFADPNFDTPARIDLLIGVKLFYNLLCVGQISLKNHPSAVLQKTQLGWIVAGEISNLSNINNETSCHISMQSHPVDFKLTKFWKMEEMPAEKPFSSEANACEAHFVANKRRLVDVRYLVRPPFNEIKNLISDFNSFAHRRFCSLEKRLTRDSALKKEYTTFMKEYEQHGHTYLCSKINNNLGFYLPHHAVIKHDSLTTKTRVVFDSSAKLSSGISLNDALMVGPKFHDDLFTILTRFRSHPVVLAANIAKMYWKIRVHLNDTPFQKNLFRFDSIESVKEYILDTVTYERHPHAAAALRRDFYVDDLLTGASIPQEAAILRDDLINLLVKGGFVLRKWASNDPRRIFNYSEHPDNTHMPLDPGATVKILGIRWNSRDDIFYYAVNLYESTKHVTKRSILSQVAQLFDPNVPIPSEIHTSWIECRKQLPSLNQIQFQRLKLSEAVSKIELGFCDASERAYGACLYLRFFNNKGHINSAIVCSKSRVAPVKTAWSYAQRCFFRDCTRQSSDPCI